MKLIRVIVLVFILGSQGFSAEEKININFKDLKIMDLIKITSKIIDKNILVTEEIKGNVDFISNKSVEKDELIKILGFVLEDKGFSLIQSENILRIVKLNDAANSNVPILNNTDFDGAHTSMVTEIFTVYNADVDYVASKIRHLITKNGKMVTNKESNTLVITDFEDNIITVKDVVSIMTNGGKKDITIVELKNMKAVDAKKSLDEIVKSLYNDKIETEKVSVIDNKDNNSIVLIGKKENINYLSKYIKNADLKGSLIKKEVKVFSLKNVEALNVIKILDSIIGKKAYIDPNDKPLSSVDEESNSIVVMGPTDELNYIEALLKELDKEKLQVYVEAKIIEVSENRTKDIGLKYGFGAGTSGSSGIFSIASNTGGKILPLPTTLINIDANLTKGIALGATLNLLKQNKVIDVVSEPSILCINNKESSIYVGETKSFQTSSLTDSTSANLSNSFKREDIGLTLKVKPRISNENKVTLEIETILEDVKEGTTGTNPDTTKKEVKTSAIVTNGEAVIIGGLIKNKSDNIKDDVPFFSDIPVLGNLFKNNKRVNDKINLVIIITPYIIPKSKDLTYIRNQLSQLSQLEEKYTKDLVRRLEENKLSKDKEDFERLKRKDELKKEKKDFNEEKKEYLGEQKEATQTKNDDRTEHEKRVAEILGN